MEAVKPVNVYRSISSRWWFKVDTVVYRSASTSSGDGDFCWSGHAGCPDRDWFSGWRSDEQQKLRSATTAYVGYIHSVGPELSGRQLGFVIGVKMRLRIAGLDVVDRLLYVSIGDD